MRIALETVFRSVRPRRRLQLRTPLRLYCNPAASTIPPWASSSTASPRLFTTTSFRASEPDPEPAVMAPKIDLRNIKTPKGTRDWDGKDVVIRQKIFQTITDVFKRHGGVTIDTPVFELREILAGKYGEDSKLIYDLADQGGEICSLRYDLTVPFARWLAMNKTVQNIKRYHIAKVYRRDQPAVTKGRMREFYQCDFDIAGAYDAMIPDAEILRIIVEVFEGLGWKGNFTIKLNHRKILDGIFEVCGVPQDKIRTISSAVDKLDKLPWADVRKEMVEEKGLPEDVADRIGEWVVLKGPGTLEKLQKDEKMAANESMKAGMADMERLFAYMECFKVSDAVSFDLSLARGLDYYTGVIYEVVTEGSAPTIAPSNEKIEAVKAPKKKNSKDPDEDRSNDPSVGVGSIAAGGRYDNLVGMFGKTQVPCVGISFGVDRIFSVIKARQAEKNNQIRTNEVDVFVMAMGGKGFTGMVQERMSICANLWEEGISAEFLYKDKPKFQNQFKAAEANGVPFALILGEDEMAQGQVRLKEMGLREGHPEKDGVLIPLADAASEIKLRLARKHKVDELTAQAEGLRVVDGIKGEDIKAAEGEGTPTAPATEAASTEPPSSAPAS